MRKYLAFFGFLAAVMYLTRRPFTNPVIGQYLESTDDRRQRLRVAAVEQDYNDGFI